MKEKILNAVTAVFICIFILCGTLLDSDSYLPVIGCLISLSWIFPYVYLSGVLNDE